jgi:hypothetical protein
VKPELTAEIGSVAPIQPATNPKPPSPIKPTLPSGRLWNLTLEASSSYDSNLYHRKENIVDSVGLVYGAVFHFQNSELKPVFQFDYGIAKHEYSNSDFWDVISHNLEGSYTWHLAKRFSLETDGEISINGSSDDQEVGNEYTVKPQLKYRISSSSKLEIYGAYRLKRYDFDPQRNATDVYVGAALKQDVWDHLVEVEARYEENDAVSFRHDYLRWTYSVSYTIPYEARNWISFQARYKPRRYLTRFVDIPVDNGPDTVARRYDQRWVYSVEGAVFLNQNMEIDAGFGYETRNSNDDDRDFNGNSPYLSFSYHW